MRTKQSHLVLLLFVLVCFISVTQPESLGQKQYWPPRTYPGNTPYPGEATWAYFARQLDGYIITPQNCTLYESTIQVYNRRTTKRPAVIVKAKSLQDIQRSILFARKYNLHLTIRSSGHDFTGKNSHPASMNIDMRDMNDVEIKSSTARNAYGEATVQSGANWGKVYQQVDLARRVIVGGYTQTVCMGGYGQGGGHSPIGREKGLAVDQLLQASIVTADGNLHIVNETSTVTYYLNGTVSVSDEAPLFWAMRGGGAGTWGVVYNYTYKLHPAPQRMRRQTIIIQTHALDGTRMNQNTVKRAFQLMLKLSTNWGGYIVASIIGIPNIAKFGSVIMFLNHFGSYSDKSNNEVNEIKNLPGVLSLDSYFPTYYLFAVTALDFPYTDSYITGSFMDNSTLTNDTKTGEYIELLYYMMEQKVFVTHTMIGGNMAKVTPGSTPVSPAFRESIFSVETFDGFPLVGTKYDPSRLPIILAYAKRLYEHGRGTYFNEPTEDMPDWKTRFWLLLEVYKRLLEIKKKVDPNNFFWCHNCVASDLSYNYGEPNSASVPGEPVPPYFYTSVEYDQIKSQKSDGLLSSLGLI